MPFDFSVDLSQLSRPDIVEAVPMKGTAAAGEKAHIKLKVHWGGGTACGSHAPSGATHTCPFAPLCLQIKAGIPERLMELVLVEVAHFEPTQVSRGRGAGAAGAGQQPPQACKRR